MEFWAAGPLKSWINIFLTVPSVKISYAIHGSNENLKQQSG